MKPGKLGWNSISIGDNINFTWKRKLEIWFKRLLGIKVKYKTPDWYRYIYKIDNDCYWTIDGNGKKRRHINNNFIGDNSND
jgi:hypothetical protein